MAPWEEEEEEDGETQLCRLCVQGVQEVQSGRGAGGRVVLGWGAGPGGEVDIFFKKAKLDSKWKPNWKLETLENTGIAE